MIPFEIMALIEDEEEYERNCGCPSDYHMSDCPITSPPQDTRDYEDEYEEFYK